MPTDPPNSSWLVLHLYCGSMRHSIFLVLLGTGHTLAASSSPTSPPLLSSPSLPSLVPTQPLPTPIPISSYTFAPFPSPSSGAPIPGVYPWASPNNPPSADQPGLVPDFTQAWANAHEKAKAKVSDLVYCYCFCLGTREREYAMHKPRGQIADALRSPDSIFVQIWK